jgi:nucleoid-associated protein YgaU
MRWILILACTATAWAQINPGAREDEAAERKKLLRAADQLEVMQAEMDTLRAQIDQQKGEVDRLKNEAAAVKNENAMLRNDVTSLKGAIEKLDAARAKEREVLLTEVSKIVAEGGKKNLPVTAPPREEVKDSELVSPKPEVSSAEETPEKGYAYTVQKGDTLWAITEAYRAQGVRVTMEEICEANRMTKHTPLRSGQKLFIPKKP